MSGSERTGHMQQKLNNLCNLREAIVVHIKHVQIFLLQAWIRSSQPLLSTEALVTLVCTAVWQDSVFGLSASDPRVNP